METESKGNWDGLRAIVVTRQSLNAKGNDSTSAQFDHMLREFLRVGLRYVDHVTLNGVSASAPKRITQIIEKLFERKRTRNDFEVIAWQIEDRASRGGGDHGMWLEHEAKRRGLRVFFAGDEGVRRPYDPVVRVVKYEAAKEAAVSTGRRSRQGQTFAKKKGTFRTSGPTPFGCYRLYLNAHDDKPKFYIRNLADGRQEQADFRSNEVIGHFGTIGEKSQHRFIKQRNEYSLLMPGDREQMRVVRVIFYLRYKRGWRGCRIADFLNRNHVRSPKGKEWSQRQVQIIYEQEAYTGVTYNDRTFSGRFFRGDKEMGFVALERDEIEMVLKKTFAPKLQPEDQWERIDQPHLYNFLPRDVRDLAIADHASIWRDRADPTRPKRKSNPQPASEYLFSGLLRAKQDGSELKGTLSGREGSYVPYYRHPRGKRGRRKGSIYNVLIRADVLHAEAVRVLADLLGNAPDLREHLTKIVVEQRAFTAADTPDAAALRAEAEELDTQIQETMRSLKGAALAAAKVELARLGDRRNDIEAMLKQMEAVSGIDHCPVDQVVDQAIAILREDSERLLTLPTALLRDLIRQYVTEATVDMETKTVELAIAVPSSVLQPKPKAGRKRERSEKKAENLLCLPQNTWSRAECWTPHNHNPWVTLKCDYGSVPGSTTQPPCYECRRHAA